MRNKIGLSLCEAAIAKEQNLDGYDLLGRVTFLSKHLFLR